MSAIILRVVADTFYTAFVKMEEMCFLELKSSEWGILLTGAEADLKRQRLQSAAWNWKPIHHAEIGAWNPQAQSVYDCVNRLLTENVSVE